MVRYEPHHGKLSDSVHASLHPTVLSIIESRVTSVFRENVNHDKLNHIKKSCI